MNNEYTHFCLNLNGISLELEGERSFVEEMYRQIMRDIEEARRRNLAAQPQAASQAPLKASSATDPGQAPRPRATPSREQVIWIHRCSPLVHRIYMGTPQELSESPVLGAIQLDRVATLYIDDALLPKLLPRFERGQTLWAELTAAGKQQMSALRPPLPKQP